MTARDRALADSEIQEALGSLPGWSRDGDAIQRTYRTDGWPHTLMAVNAIGYACEAGFHHPDLFVSWGEVRVRLWTHTASGITAKDFEMARLIDRVLLQVPDKGSVLTGPPEPLIKPAR
ncbi:MAG: 4a-hydroxytetrahydrobiopterin dehydratase [Gemmatimonadales bacterium]